MNSSARARLVLALVVVIVGVACKRPSEPEDDSARASASRPKATAYFYDETKGTEKAAARVLVTGVALEEKPSGALVYWKRVTLYGHSNVSTVKDLHDARYKLGADEPRGPRRSLHAWWPVTKIPPNAYAIGWTSSEWESGKPYYVLVHTEYEENDGQSRVASEFVTDELLAFTDIKPSPRIIGKKYPPDVSSTVAATGTYFAAQRLLLYDVTVDYPDQPPEYPPPPAEHPYLQTIEVRHCPVTGMTPTPALLPAHLGGLDEPPALGSTLWRSTLRGRYHDDIDSYMLLFEITYSNVAPDLEQLLFSDVSASAGSLMTGR